MQRAEAQLQPAREVPAHELVELTARLRTRLAERGEPLAPGWPELAAERLRTGEIDGWVARQGDQWAGLVVVSRRASRAYGHLHIESPDDRVGLALRLLLHAVSALGPDVHRADFGSTGLAMAEERRLADQLGTRPGFEIVERFGLIRPLSLDAPPVAPKLPEGYEFLPVGSAPVDALDQLDRRAFQGGPDEALVADSPGGNQRVLERILDGELGRFLPEASTVVLLENALAGFLLTTEENARVASFADLAVDPGYRRRGIAGAMLGRGMRALLALGYSSVRLWVTAANVPARELYRSLGFEPERTALLFRWWAGRRP
ncbi:MAG TPA: GNAT family N-acetyltransferase [Thermoplasmata archaeon]|nr:GNAT family N-acetyltransferase [Thermoplasmata archaeon]